MTTCPICSEGVGEGEFPTLVCGHVFHHACLTAWFQHDHVTCPTCRATVIHTRGTFPWAWVVGPLYGVGAMLDLGVLLWGDWENVPRSECRSHNRDPCPPWPLFLWGLLVMEGLVLLLWGGMRCRGRRLPAKWLPHTGAWCVVWALLGVFLMFQPAWFTRCSDHPSCLTRGWAVHPAYVVAIGFHVLVSGGVVVGTLVWVWVRYCRRPWWYIKSPHSSVSPHGRFHTGDPDPSTVDQLYRTGVSTTIALGEDPGESSPV